MVGLVKHENTNNFLKKKFPDINDMDWYQKGFEVVLGKNKIKYQIIGEKELNNLDSMMQFELICLPNVLCTSDKQNLNLKEYFNNGGKIFATFGSTARNEKGDIRDDIALSDIFGVSCTGDKKTQQWNELPFGYIVPRAKHPVTKDLEINKPILYSYVLSPKWSPLLKIIKNEITIVASLANYTGEDMNFPAIVLKTKGKSKCFYSGPALSYRLGDSRIQKDNEEIEKLLFNGINWLLN